MMDFTFYEWLQVRNGKRLSTAITDSSNTELYHLTYAMGLEPFNTSPMTLFEIT